MTEYQIHSGSCNRCHQKQVGALPSGISFSMLGQRATAMTANLSAGPALWRFLETDGVEPTNNLAERLIRTIAIWRKTSFGTQSKAGSLYMERIMTVVATCKLQGKNILDYLTCAVKCHLEKSSFPSLLRNPLKIARFRVATYASLARTNV